MVKYYDDITRAIDLLDAIIEEHLIPSEYTESSVIEIREVLSEDALEIEDEEAG